MANIRLKAASIGGLALDVSANTINATHGDAGISLDVELVDSELSLIHI